MSYQKLFEEMKDDLEKIYDIVKYEIDFYQFPKLAKLFRKHNLL